MKAYTVTQKQMDYMRHAVGDKSKSEGSRNYFWSADNNPELEDLVSQGLMAKGYTVNDGRDRYYHVTEAGYRLLGLV